MYFRLSIRLSLIGNMKVLAYSAILFFFFFLLALVSLSSTQTPEGSLYQIPASPLSEQVDRSN